MCNKGVNGSIVFINGCDHFRKQRRGYCFATTPPMCRCIKRQHFITFLYEGSDILFKIYNRRLKSMNDENSFRGTSIPSITVDRIIFKGKFQLFSFIKNCRWLFFGPALGSSKKVKSCFCSFLLRKKRKHLEFHLDKADSNFLF